MKNKSIINIIDIEATCWDHKTINKFKSEIIEIGITEVMLDSLEIKNSESILIKPLISKVSPFCTALTGHTQIELDTNGNSFRQAISYLKNKYESNKRMWVSWGDYDRIHFQKTFEDYDLKYKDYLFIRHLNLKTLFAQLYAHTKERGLEQALTFLRMNFDGRYHNGADDSKNIARIYVHIMKKFRRE